MESIPTHFLVRLQKILATKNYQAYLDSLSQEKVTAFRINTIRITVNELLSRLTQYGLAPVPIKWCPGSYFLPHEKRRSLTETEEFKQGLIYIQNAASMFASLTLDPQPGEEILDLAAAPGGKTLHIASLMQNEGRIAAVEAVKDRFYRLKKNVQLAGASIVHCYHKDGSSIWRLVPERFDRVLLDAPCSSEGRFDLDNPNSYSYWSEKKVAEMARKQKKLLYSGLACLKTNGILVYCTCSFSPEENEAIIQYILDRFPNSIEILPIDVPFENYQPGLGSWGDMQFDETIQRCVRIIPNEMMSGFFVCKLRKK